MSHTWTIARRETSSFFFSPIAYLVTAAFVLLAGFLFVSLTFQPDRAAEMRGMFEALVWVLMAVSPAVSMRLIAEELRSGTIETIATAPVSDAALVVGKWLGALAFFGAMLAPTLAFVAILEVFADPDYGPIVSGYVGLILVGGLFLAIGVFTSVLTRNQIVAFVLSLFVILVLTLVTWMAPGLTGPEGAGVMPEAWPGRLLVLGIMLAACIVAGGIVGLAAGDWAAAATIALAGAFGMTAVWAALIAISGPWVGDVMYFLNVNRQYEDFAKGLIDLSNVTFFAGGIALFLVLATKALESRKWR